MLVIRSVTGVTKTATGLARVTVTVAVAAAAGGERADAFPAAAAGEQAGQDADGGEPKEQEREEGEEVRALEAEDPALGRGAGDLVQDAQEVGALEVVFGGGGRGGSRGCRWGA